MPIAKTTNNLDNKMTAQAAPPDKPPKKPQKKHTKVDVQKALNLRVNNKLSYREIAALQGNHPTSVHKALQRFLPDDKSRDFQTNKADILNKVQMMIVEQVDSKRLKGASLNNLAYAFQNFHNSERLDRGESTSNVDIRSITARADTLLEYLKVEGNPIDLEKIDEKE